MAWGGLIPSSASAHGFGQRYELPLPLSLYLFAAAAAVVLSFVVVGLFVREVPAARTDLRVGLPEHPAPSIRARDGFVLALQLLALVLFVVTILAGFLGDQNPYRNIAPTMVWIIFWVGFAYISALVGNLWGLINPWRTIFLAAQAPFAKSGDDPSLRVPFPDALGVWPACVLLLAFSWFELVYPDPAAPRHIAWVALAYSGLTWSGMLVFGREAWLRHGELFTVVFGVFARLAPIDVSAEKRRGWTLRPFGAGLVDGRPASASMTAFVLLLLSTVLYDGLLGTPEWSEVERVLGAALSGFGERGPIVIRTAGLVAFWLLFLASYGAVSALINATTGGRLGPMELARRFVFTLVPIAIGYHIAHYLVFLLIQGQYVIPLASDPFGYGWNLFGTAGYRVDIGLVGARFAWYAAVTAIVLGHVAAVYFAHVTAMRVFGTRNPALRSQVPLTALMVVYTFVSLSILAEPITERRTPAQPTSATAGVIAVPPEAVLPDPDGGAVRAVGSGKLARTKLTYRVLGSAFHDGSKVTAADLLYSYLFAYRWGVRRDGDDAHYDPVVDSATASMRDHLVGLRVQPTDATSKTFRVGDVSFVRELLVVDLYTTIAPDNAEQDGLISPPWSTLPWHLLVLMEEAVGRGWAAFSQDEARRRDVEWLDLVRSDAIKKKLALLVAGFEREGFRPAALRSLVGEDEARKRWTALAAFYNAYGHFLVTNGPYRLKQWSATSGGLEAFRDLSYPLGVGSYDAYAIPRRGYVTKVEWHGLRAKLSGDLEVVEKFQRSYRLVRTPIEAVAAVALKRAALECRYIVLDDNDRVVLAGVAPLGENTTFQLDLTGRLPPGRYIIAAVVAVNGNVIYADIRRIPLSVSVDR